VIPQSDLTLVAVSVPSDIVVYKPFTIECVLSNMRYGRTAMQAAQAFAKDIADLLATATDA
jgi:hypothetical protein